VLKKALWRCAAGLGLDRDAHLDVEHGVAEHGRRDRLEVRAVLQTDRRVGVVERPGECDRLQRSLGRRVERESPWPALGLEQLSDGE